VGFAKLFVLRLKVGRLNPDRRVAVIRGRVVTPQGLGIMSIRVSVDRDQRFGFTLTRAGGW
jgi:hypothetical protein